MWHKLLSKSSFIIYALLLIVSCDQQHSSQTTTTNSTENKHTFSRQTLIRGGEFSHFQTQSATGHRSAKQ